MAGVVVVARRAKSASVLRVVVVQPESHQLPLVPRPVVGDGGRCEALRAVAVVVGADAERVPEQHAAAKPALVLAAVAAFVACAAALVGLAGVGSASAVLDDLRAAGL